MDALIGHATSLGGVAVKAALLFLTAVVALRVAPRRTLADMTAVDFVAAVAVGAIVGRVPNASDASFLLGAATLVTVLAVHAGVTRLRQWTPMGALLDHPPRVLVADGRLQEEQLRRCGLTRADLFGLLRQKGVFDLDEVAYAIYEQRGRISVVRADAVDPASAGLLEQIVGRTPLDDGSPAPSPREVADP